MNIKGTFNRCSLPSLALVQYDRLVSQETKTPDEEPTFSKTAANRDKRKGRGVKEEKETGTNRPEKKRKLWRGGYKEGEEWGSQGLDIAVSEFLYRGLPVQEKSNGRGLRQTTLKLTVREGDNLE